MHRGVEDIAYLCQVRKNGNLGGTSLADQASKLDKACGKPDKRALAFQAKQAGAESKKWYAELSLRKSESQTVSLLNNYWASAGGRAKWNGGTRVGIKFNLAQFRETVKAAQGVSRTNRGKMMWHKEFIHYAQSYG
eukprot:1096333-Amphidinium_carterae.1